MRRSYQLKERATRMEETKRRIAAATMELHASIGPSNTTVSAIADRAGVQRLTVYRHFPDQRELFQACVEHGLSVMPLPDPEPWREITDPRRRLRAGLTKVYRYFRQTETAWANILPDLPKMPALLEANEPVFAHWDRVREALIGGWALPAGRRRLLEAAIGLALDFHTWRSLAKDEGLADDEAADVFVRLAGCLAT
ncbi:MAG TPA: helix-turn-helix domain-containing protein [Actinomycetota bacterium]|nr:helix-turn-helix domain-containing protein [Actinomycetota bacterium]